VEKRDAQRCFKKKKGGKRTKREMKNHVGRPQGIRRGEKKSWPRLKRGKRVVTGGGKRLSEWLALQRRGPFRPWGKEKGADALAVLVPENRSGGEGRNEDSIIPKKKKEAPEERLESCICSI